MATETIGVLETVVGGPAHLVGWSDGGIVALLVALRRPDLIGKLVPIGANYHHDGLADLSLDLDSPVVAMIAQAYGALSPDGPDHFPVVLGKATALFANEPTLTTDDLQRITAPTLVLSGDDDGVRLDHTCSMFLALPAGQLAVVPGSSHAVPIEKPADVTRLVVDFLSSGPPETFMPMLRAASTS